MKQYDERTNTSYEIDTNDLAIVSKTTGQVIVDSPDLTAILKKTYGQKAFWKVYMADLIQVILGSMDYKQLDVLMYISLNTQPSTNLFIGTQRQVAKACDCSLETVRKLFKRLQDNEYLKIKQNGVYMVNPMLVMKGNIAKKNILLQYWDGEQINHPLPVKKTPKRLNKNNPIDSTAEEIHSNETEE